MKTARMIRAAQDEGGRRSICRKLRAAFAEIDRFEKMWAVRADEVGFWSPQRQFDVQCLDTFDQVLMPLLYLRHTSGSLIVMLGAVAMSQNPLHSRTGVRCG